MDNSQAVQTRGGISYVGVFSVKIDLSVLPFLLCLCNPCR